MAIGSDQGSKECAKADHDKPVRKANDGEVEHLRMADDLLSRHTQTLHAIISAGWIWLTFFVDAYQLPYADRQHNEGEDRDPIGDNYEEEVHKRRLSQISISVLTF